MGTPIPARTREAIVHAYHQRGLSYSQIAALLRVGQATVNRVLRLHRETGAVEPRPKGGGNPSPIRGDGWTLELNAGWTMTNGERKGDFVVKKSE